MSREPIPAEHARLPGVVFTPLAVSGLICAYRFAPDAAPVPLEPGDVAGALAGDGQGWVWLHLNITDRFARNWLSELDVLPEEVHEMFAAADEPLNITLGDDIVHGVIADFQEDLNERTDTIGRLRFAVSPHLVITARRQSLQAIRALRRKVQRGLSPEQPGQIVEMVADHFCDSCVRLNTRMIAELDQAEDHVVAEMVESERARVVGVRRLALRLHRQLSALSSVFANHAEEEDDEGGGEAEKPVFPAALRLDAARLANRLESIDHDLLTVQDRAKLLQDEVAARLAEDTNRSLRALSIMTALLLPGSLVAGIFGMNTHGLPFLDTPGGFWFAMAIGGGATALFYWLLRRVGAGLRL